MSQNTKKTTMSKLISGESYNIAHIFCGENNKVVIPDLQRDYCWGNPELNLVSGFIDGLMETDKSEAVPMGLLYGYYNGLIENHLQLCDGQQRLTTIFLLIGMINRKLGFSHFRKYLMSDFEFNHDDKEPYLQYAIRDSSLYFISDLTTFFFLADGVTCVNDIIRQPWFLSSYSLDPTVTSILHALRTIEDRLNQSNEEQLYQLGDFLTEKVEFIFYDMGSREEGEETFVIINTTGEPLSAAQNLKPLVIDSNRNVHIQDSDSGEEKSVSELWETMESWFWQNRCLEGVDHPHTADEGLVAFLNIVRLFYCRSEEDAYKTIEAKDRFPYKEISFKQIWDVFLIYKRLTSIDFSYRLDRPVHYLPKDEFFTQIQLYAILPTIVYCNRFKEAVDEDVRRIYHFFSNIARYRDVSRQKEKDNNDRLSSPLYRAMRRVERMSSMDFLSLRELDIREEEMSKLEMIASITNTEERLKLEHEFSEAESNDIFNGRIKVLVTMAKEGPYDFFFYWKSFQEKWEDKDLVRRALLAYNLPNYPIKNGNMYSLCDSSTQWYDMLVSSTNYSCLKQFLEHAGSLTEIIDGFSDQDNKMYQIIKNPKLIEFSFYKNLYIYGDVLIIMNKERASADYKIVYGNERYSKSILSRYKEKWSAIWYWEPGMCIYSDNIKLNLTIDYFILPEGYRIRVWEGKNPQKKHYEFYEQLYALGLTKTDDGRWETPIITEASDAKAKMIDIGRRIDDNVPLK